MLIPFNYGDNLIRTIQDENGVTLWVAKDVCKVLEYKNSRDVLKKLDDDEKGVSEIATPSGNQKMTCINESGLYSLILRSNKPEAKKFKKWVTSEVLPSIRKTGSYGGENITPFIETLVNAQNNQIAVQNKQTELLINMSQMLIGLTETKRTDKEPITPREALRSKYLDATSKRKIRTAVKKRALEIEKSLCLTSDVMAPALWIDLKKHFEVEEYHEIEQCKYDAVIDFINSWSVKKTFIIKCENVEIAKECEQCKSI